MNSRSLIAVFCTLAVCASAVAEDLRKVAERHQREFAQAVRTKDLTWFEKVAGPDFRQIGTKGNITDRAASIAQMKQMFAMGKVTSLTTKVLKVTGTPAQMVVLVDSHMTAEMMMDPKAKKPSKMVADERYEETWSKSKGKWHIHMLKTIKQHATLNGKPFDTGM